MVIKQQASIDVLHFLVIADAVLVEAEQDVERDQAEQEGRRAKDGGAQGRRGAGSDTDRIRESGRMKNARYLPGLTAA
jgi:hypothetical protein